MPELKDAENIEFLAEGLDTEKSNISAVKSIIQQGQRLFPNS